MEDLKLDPRSREPKSMPLIITIDLIRLDIQKAILLPMARLTFAKN